MTLKSPVTKPTATSHTVKLRKSRFERLRLEMPLSQYPLSRGCLKRRKHQEALNKIETEIQFAQNLQAYFPSAWPNPTTGRSWDEPKQGPRPCHFMRLPPELRLTIYEYVFEKRRVIDLYGDRRDSRWTKPGILLVSKDVRCEVLSVFFKANDFILHTSLVNFDRAVGWLETVAFACGRNPFGSLRFHVFLFTWSALPQTRRLVQLLAFGMLELDLSCIDPTVKSLTATPAKEKSLFMMSDVQGGIHMQRAMEEAVLLGATAREQGWSHGRVYQQFETLMALKLPLRVLEAYTRDNEKKRIKKAKNERRRRRRAGEIE